MSLQKDENGNLILCKSKEIVTLGTRLATGKVVEQCWSQALPLVTLKEVVALSQSIVEQNLKTGQCLLIDEQFTKEHPIPSNSELYDRLGKAATRLTIRRIDEDQLEQIFGHFPNITHLMLEKVWILRDIKGAPAKIQHLKLSCCIMSPSFTIKWFQLINSSIESINLDRSDADEYLHEDERYGSATEFIEALAKSTIRKIEVSGMVCYNLEEFNDSKSLEYVSVDQTYEQECTKSTVEMDYFALKGQSLQPLFDEVKESRCQRLILRIIRCNSEEERNKLNPDKEHLKKKIIDHNPPAREPNLILQKLNDDCLLKILTYLSVDDYFSLYNTHPHFKRCFLENTLPLGDVQTEWVIEEYPLEEHRSAYKAIFRNITSLEVEYVGVTEIREIFSYCKNLKSLKLKDVEFEFEDLNGDEAEIFPSELTTLEMGKIVPVFIWTKWGHRLNATLRVLKYIQAFPDYERQMYEEEISNNRRRRRDDYNWALENLNFVGLPDFTSLHNIREFEARLYRSDVPKTLPSFLDQNRDSLENLVITFDLGILKDSSDDKYGPGAGFCDYDEGEPNYSDPDNEYSNVLPKLKNLKKLHLRCFTPDDPCDISDLSSLEELGIDYHRDLKVKRENIKKLVVYECKYHLSGQMTMKDIVKFKNLEELELIQIKFKDFKPLSSLSQLKTLRIDCYDLNVENIIKEVPQPTRFHFVRRAMSLELVSWLRKYAKEKNKSLQVNDVQFGDVSSED